MREKSGGIHTVSVCVEDYVKCPLAKDGEKMGHAATHGSLYVGKSHKNWVL
jgi:hypothetical protein